MNEDISHTYYLSLEAAQACAMESQRQDWLHYYDGPALENPPLNLIQVPVEKFSAFFSETTLPLPSRMLDENGETVSGQVLQVFEDILREVREFRQQLDLATQGKPACDTYFVDRQIAWHTARQANRVRTQHPRIDGLQICYYDAPAFSGDVPENLVCVSSDELLPFLVYTDLRLPTKICYPINAEESERNKVQEIFKQLLEKVNAQRDELANELARRCSLLNPDFSQPDPWRVLLISSRLTEVLQYSSRGICKALNQLGYQAKLVIEDNDMQQLSAPQILAQYYEFNPHITVNINHLNNQCLSPDTINFIWWQDPMPALSDTTIPLNLRERDITLSLSKTFDDMLAKKGIHDVHRQRFCIDTDIFKPDNNRQRKNKVVFIGSSYYLSFARSSAQEKQLIQAYIDYLENGERIDVAMVKRLAAKFNVDEINAATYLLNYAIRETSVTWLCQNVDMDMDMDMDVEVYGRHWEHNEIVAPYFKGELKHGEAIAEVYQVARYALVSHATEIHSQRLIEAAACGCIPLVYDCRHWAEPPYWEEACVYFSNAEQLKHCLSLTGKTSPEIIAENDSYIKLAERIIELSKQKLQQAIKKCS